MNDRPAVSYKDRLRAPRALMGAIGALLGANLILSGAVAAVALRRLPVVVVPGVRESQVVVPDQVPDAAARKFVHLYLGYFDDYTPETIEERSSFILRFVAPEILGGVRRELQERATYVVRAQESSHLTLPPPDLSPAAAGLERLEGGLLRIEVSGLRRTTIASEPKGAARIRYVLTLRPVLPTDRDAYGFVVVAQTIRTEPPAPNDGAREGAAHGRP
jgi:hypothetical protein